MSHHVGAGMKEIRLRRWLVPNGTVDSYMVLTASTDTNKKKQRTWTWVDLKIADCNRTISLQFNFEDERQRQRALRKLSRMEDMLAKLRFILEG